MPLTYSPDALYGFMLEWRLDGRTLGCVVADEALKRLGVRVAHNGGAHAVRLARRLCRRHHGQRAASCWRACSFPCRDEWRRRRMPVHYSNSRGYGGPRRLLVIFKSRWLLRRPLMPVAKTRRPRSETQGSTRALARCALRNTSGNLGDGCGLRVVAPSREPQ